MIGSGRMLRCAKCGRDWLVPGGAAPSAAPPPATRPESPTPQSPTPQSPAPESPMPEMRTPEIRAPETRRPAPAPASAPPAHGPSAGDLPPPTPSLRRPPQLIHPPLPQAGKSRLPRLPVLALWVAWIGSALILAALATTAWVYRGPIIEAWPPAARIYLWLGAADLG